MSESSNRTPKTLTVIITESVIGGYYGYIKEIPSVISQGESEEETKENLKDALWAYIDSFVTNGDVNKLFNSLNKGKKVSESKLQLEL